MIPGVAVFDGEMDNSGLMSIECEALPSARPRPLVILTKEGSRLDGNGRAGGARSFACGLRMTGGRAQDDDAGGGLRMTVQAGSDDIAGHPIHFRLSAT